MELSIVLPAWNEAENLPPLVQELRASLQGVTDDYEIVVVDGGSKDGTPEVAGRMGCRVVTQRTPGYGGALREGFAAARGAYICTLDADLSHPPTFIQEMWRRRTEAEVIVASRYVPGGSADMPRTRAVLSRVLNATFRELLSLPVRDLSSGFRLYRRSALEAFETRGRNFNVLQELLTGILARGGRALEVPFHYRPRIFGASHARIIRFGISYLGSLWHLFFLRTSLFRGEPATRWLPYALVIAVTLGSAYVNALGNGSVRWDDDYLVFLGPDGPGDGEGNPALRSLSPAALAAMFDPRVPRAAYGSQYQPIADLSYALDARIFGWKNHRHFHLQGILWHILAATLLFAVANRQTRSAGVALAAALLFGLHPVCTESVTWISGRRTAMSAALLLLAALCWLRYRRTGRPGALAASLGAALLAGLAKQTGVATPLVLLACDLTGAEPPRRRRLILPLLPHALLAAAMSRVAYDVGVREGILGPHPLGLAGQVQSALLALAHYARMTILPLGLRPSYGLVFEPTEFALALAAGAAAALGWLAAIVFLRRRAPAAAFGLAAALAALTPAVTGLGTQFVAERYFYLPLAFLAIAAGDAFTSLARVGPPPADLATEQALVTRRRRLTGALIAVLLAMGVLTHLRNRAWRDDVSLWSDAAAVEPRNRIARRLHGRALMRRAAPGDSALAEEELRVAATLEAQSRPLRGPSPLPFVLGDIALLCEQRGDWAEAERLLYAALDAAADSERAYVQLGDHYRRRGEIAKARAVYQAFADRDPAARAVRARLADLPAAPTGTAAPPSPPAPGER